MSSLVSSTTIFSTNSPTISRAIAYDLKISSTVRHSVLAANAASISSRWESISCNSASLALCCACASIASFACSSQRCAIALDVLGFTALAIKPLIWSSSDLIRFCVFFTSSTLELRSRSNTDFWCWGQTGMRSPYPRVYF